MCGMCVCEREREGVKERGRKRESVFERGEREKRERERERGMLFVIYLFVKS